MNDYTEEQLRAANPSMFAAQNGDVKTAINVLREEVDSLNPSMDKELLEATALYLENEVL